MTICRAVWLVPLVLVVTAEGTIAVPVLPPLERSGKTLTALEQKLHGQWRGGDCAGEITFQAGGTYGRKLFGPGNASLTGTWEIVWNALPPTLVMICTASTDKDYIGRTIEVKITELTDKTFSYKFPNAESSVQFERVK